MTKMNSSIIMLVLVVCMIFAGCTKENNTEIIYTFKNNSKKIVNVIGGAGYRLIKNNKVVDEGGVPTKDYIDLEPNQDYTDIKTFSKLEPGSYTCGMEQNYCICCFCSTNGQVS
ncbi:hypothetical protein [Paenibacillus sp. Z3-2]